MVIFWDEVIEFELQRIKRRISLAEKHGIGSMAIEEKARLKRLERNKELRKQ